MKRYRWELAQAAPEQFTRAFPQIPSLTLNLLWNRGLRTQEVIDEFFSPDYEGDLHDPFLMPNMEKAVRRILEAREKNEKVVVHGDYDVDGMTGATVLLDVLDLLDVRASGFIPNRYRDGYGLSHSSIDRFVDDDVDVVITVDCGISNADQVAHGNEKGLTTIITDHHFVPERLPEAYAIVHPLLPDSSYPYKWLTGVGVAYKLALALLERARREHLCDIPEGWEKWLLDLVALGTVADCGDMLGENRTLLSYGLKVLAKTRRKGLLHLFERAKIDRENLTVWSIMWQLAPRINAPSRVEDPLPSFNLLRAKTDDEASAFAWKMEGYNDERKELAEAVRLDVERQYGETLPTSTLIFAVGEGWREGVLGLVAGKLMEEFGVPVGLFVKRASGEIAGSFRSPEAFNIIEHLTSMKELFLQFGGHAQAAGLSFAEEKTEEFRKRLHERADVVFKGKDIATSLVLDAQLSHDALSWETFDEVQKFQPHGRGNEVPIFLTSRLKVNEFRIVGNGGKHVKCQFETEHGKIIPGIAFGSAHLVELFPKGAFVDVAGKLSANTWNGTRELQLEVVDVRASEA